MRVESRAHGVSIEWEGAYEEEQFQPMLDALAIYSQRNMMYKDNWRRFGWRGCLFRLRERVERAWDHLWDAELPQTDYTKFVADSQDDLLDLINFAAFTVRALGEGNRDGSWW